MSIVNAPFIKSTSFDLLSQIKQFFRLPKTVFVFCVFFAFDRVCVYRAQIVLAEQVYWFHLDLRHLGGDLLVNRLVHELR